MFFYIFFVSLVVGNSYALASESFNETVHRGPGDRLPVTLQEFAQMLITSPEKYKAVSDRLVQRLALRFKGGATEEEFQHLCIRWRDLLIENMYDVEKTGCPWSLDEVTTLHEYFQNKGASVKQNDRIPLCWSMPHTCFALRARRSYIYDNGRYRKPIGSITYSEREPASGGGRISYVPYLSASPEHLPGVLEKKLSQDLKMAGVRNRLHRSMSDPQIASRPTGVIRARSMPPGDLAVSPTISSNPLPHNNSSGASDNHALWTGIGIGIATGIVYYYRQPLKDKACTWLNSTSKAQRKAKKAKKIAKK